MERIFYAGSSVLTGTVIARSLLAYAEALALTKGSVTVDIPIRQESGRAGRAALLIGPASQLFSESEDDGSEEIVDEELVERLTRETARLGVSHPVPEQDGGAGPLSAVDTEIPRFHSEDDSW
ncbi:hypothetical protein [Rathayibacter sp. VKM Ac-2801]|uniref:hypothetical protein n=1 Tax=Rathayibacter sp. VKM Ac-2801 TaxID=2609255 RepID=UPI00131F4E7E|nr:hypothetical protein [Rathayibacter sp. VKM Ac-2801]QHC69060.1 hypothetical protein GSU45_00775 [Rathayibacter sp. VKM Ac-2801]